MRIVIRAKKTQVMVADYTVNLVGLDHTPGQEAYVAEAWRCAVEDKAVVEGSQSEYEFAVYEN